MAYGRSVVATAVGGLRDAVDDGVTGLIVPPRDSEALRGAIERLLDDRELRRRLGRAARDVAEREFSWHEATSAMIAAYRDALGARPDDR
jgi:glycosyltransferase involved in cell wall biosynthesis